jgi:hypothetical protein
MEQKKYNLESKINIIYDFVYNLNTSDCYSFEKIIIENISIDDIKIPLIDNNKDSKQDIEIYNNYKTDILNTRFKITSFNNDTKQILEILEQSGGRKSISIHHRTLEEILDSEFFHAIANGWKKSCAKEGKLISCSFQCGEHLDKLSDENLRI